jgi:lipopolysaccharide export system permease protein
MKLISRMVYRESARAIAFVTAGFLALFFFFDFADEIQNISAAYPLARAFLYVLLLMPGRLYELLPIAVLIGTIYVMSRLAQSSEFTILRTSGLGPWRALRSLLAFGLAFFALTFAIGDYLVPQANRAAQLIKAQREGRITTGQTGAWLKERQADGNAAVNISALDPSGQMLGVRVFEFDAKGMMSSMTEAATARFGAAGSWQLQDVRRTELDRRASGATDATRAQDTPRVRRLDAPSLDWASGITEDMVSAALLKPERMGTLDLFMYIRHLRENGQSAQRYEIEFWRKAFYPLGCVVMVMLALPFAYLHFRAGGISTYVFGGIMAGISFFLLSNVFGYIGNLRDWQPWLAAAAPGMIYCAASLASFGWLVLRR